MDEEIAMGEAGDVAASVVLVNGLPGSGKTTLAVRLGALMDLPVLSKDAVKEVLADLTGPAFTRRALGRAAMAAIWQLTGAPQGPVIVDSFWYRPRDLEIARAGLHSTGAVHAVQLWCDVPPQIALSRYAARKRHQIHDDQQRLADEWQSWAQHAQPLELSPVIRVDTVTAVDVPALAEDTNDELLRKGSAGLIGVRCRYDETHSAPA